MDNTALIVIDMQEGLLERQVYKKQELINNANTLMALFRENSIVVLCRHTNKSFSMINTDEWQICKQLKLADTDFVLDKTHSSIFKEKQFIKLLKDNSIKNIVVSGLVSNGCVQTACIDGKNLGFNVTLVSDAHSTWHKDAEQVINNWNSKLAANGIILLTTNETKNLLKGVDNSLN